ncbi:hypothetical protein AW878_14115 [Bordetella pseudohinzii]|uniref:Secreted protein n=1 Tax=Bordetella pseudohinzii TaxID=1331258 RepID=A0ABM6DKR6_9BORD|nr:hypothetical protein BBN53_20940 [Bordetella pseudohinzii]KMM24105.1 hypothetical protein L540_08240 [Bordetella pseudohinzii]KXA77827.1 hypothetical protein AW878_14115 [Bordetella pseudohinzii]KXA78023.1 hypothetical protein AW877_12575 [Bordetella pseudohinzii]
MPACILDLLTQFGIVVQLELRFLAIVAVAHDMHPCIRQLFHVLLEQFHAVSLPVNHPKGYEFTLQFLEGVFQRLAVRCDTFVISCCRIDEYRMVFTFIATVHQIYPAVSRIEIEKTCFQFLAVHLVDIWIGGIRFYQ